MGWIHALTRRKRLQQSMEEELRLHVEMQFEENLRAGMDARQAQFEAERSFGQMENIKEECRDQNGVSLIEALALDTRFALRLMRKNPGFTAVAALTLALGAGASTAIYSVVDGVLLRPLPLPEPGRLVYIWENDRLRKSEKESASLPDYLDIRKQAQSYESLAAYQRLNLTLTGQGEAERLAATRVSHDYFHVLAVRPVIGREFTEDEEKASSAVLLGYGLWKRRFSMSPAVLGANLILDGQRYTVAGVMPPEANEALAPLHREEVWIPVTYQRNDLYRGRHITRVLGRLKPGISVEQAHQEITVIMSNLEKGYPDDNKGRGAYVIRAHDDLTQNMQRPLYVLLGSVLVLLLIGCANVANLLLARSFSREQEMAVRAFLGAGSRRLIRQLATENLVLAIAGGTLGWLFAVWGTHALLALAPEGLPRLDQVHPGAAAFFFSLGIVLLSWLVFGLLPAGRTADPAHVRAGRGNTQRMRHILIAAEVGLAVVLVVSAGLLGRSFYRLTRVDLQLNTQAIFTLTVDLPAAQYKMPRTWPIVEWTEVTSFLDRAMEQIRRTPGVQSVAATVSSLARGAWTTRVTVDGRPIPPPGEQDEAEFRIVTPSYFQTLGVAIHRGRFFSDSDDKDHTLVAIVNEAFARKEMPNENPLGKRIRIYGRLHEVVGVSSDARYGGAGAPVEPAMYVPFRQFPMSSISFVVRSSSQPATIERVIRATDPNIAAYDAFQLERVFASSIALQRFTLVLIGAFAGISLILAAAGVYAVISFTVTRQTREIGIRMALGAGRWAMFQSTVASALFRVSMGLAVGLAGALIVSRALGTLLHEITPWDPWTYIGVTAILLATGIAATIIPAWRASRVEPVTALRYE